MSNVECRMWSENALNPVKSPFSVYLALPSVRVNEKKKGAAKYERKQYLVEKEKFSLSLLVKQESSNLPQRSQRYPEQPILRHR